MLLHINIAIVIGKEKKQGTKVQQSMVGRKTQF